MRKLLVMLVAMLIAVPVSGFAADDLQLQIQELQKQIDEMAERVDSAEKKTSTDRINWYGDFRTKADAVHYKDVAWNPAVNVDFNAFAATVFASPASMAAWGYNIGPDLTPMTGDDFFAPGSPLGNFGTAYGITPAMLPSFTGVVPFPLIPGMMGAVPVKGDINNDILYTTRLRLGMKAKVWDNVDFSGRLSMYKNWGDSTGVKVFDSWNAFTMDGTNGGNTTGDFVHVERAYFDWKDIGGSNAYLSIGRRPSTYGPPSHYRENELRGGTPSGHLVNFNFDGITAGYKLGEHTGIEGQTVRFCYGQGYESQYGNGELYNNTTTKDTHLGGFNIDVINDGTNFVQLTAFAAENVVDGFKGTFAFPTEMAAIFAPTMYKDMQKFPTFNFVTRYMPSTDIGDMKLGGLGFAREEENGLSYFGSLGWTRLEPNGKAGMFGGMGTDAVFEAQLSADGSEIIMMPARAENDDVQDGYGVYVGVQIPAPAGKIGLEYNYGSEYWTPFTQAQDDVMGSKLAVRGQVGEAYYIVEVNPNMFIKVAGLYYDYKYTGSGSPVGKPQKVDDVLAGKAYSMMPVVDTAWDANIALTVKF